MARQPRKKSHAGKIIIILLALIVIGFAGYGYLSQRSELKQDANAQTAQAAPPLPPTDPLFTPKPGELIIGSATAPVTLIEYSSLSCPHCAHFHNEILPQLKKQFFDTGRARLVFRFFPLNEPALRASQLIECSHNREQLTKILFEQQPHWAFTESFRNELKNIAANNGIDSAAYESCLNDKEGENAILATRQEAATGAHVDSTPSFFLNGVKLENPNTAEGFIAALNAAGKPPAAQAPSPAQK